MISGKGILYTVIGAASAAVIVGTMLTRGKRGESMRNVGSKLQNFFGSSRKNESLASDKSSPQQLTEAGSLGHS